MPGIFDDDFGISRNPVMQIDPLAALVQGPGGILAGASQPRLTAVRGPVESHPDFVYHATNAERAADIASMGLRRFRPNEFTDQRTWPDGATERRSYFTPTAQNSWQFAPEEGMPVLLRVPAAGHPFKRETTGDIYSTKDVPASKIEALSDKGWLPLTSIFGDALRSLFGK